MSAKTKTRAKATVLDEPTTAPLVGPQTKDEWFLATMRAMNEKNPPFAAREEYRNLLELFPFVAEQHGDLPVLFRRATADRFSSQPVIEEAIKHQMKLMRTQLAGGDATPTELLLIDAVLACYHDYWTFSMVYEQKNGSGFNLDALEKWERVLASKETRYLRAVETLARVRRLLKLPTMQVNIAAAGGQQVNVSGDVKP